MNNGALRALLADVEQVKQLHPELNVSYKNKIPHRIYGRYKVINNNGMVQEEYDIEVIIPSQYPHGFPVLKVIGDKIKREDERHLSKEGIACVDITRRIELLVHKGINLVFFLRTMCIASYVGR